MCCHSYVRSQCHDIYLVSLLRSSFPASRGTPARPEQQPRRHHIKYIPVQRSTHLSPITTLMSSEGPYGRQGFQSNPAGYGGGDYTQQPQYGYGGGYGAPPPPQAGVYGAQAGAYGADYSPYVESSYEVRHLGKESRPVRDVMPWCGHSQQCCYGNLSSIGDFSCINFVSIMY